MSEKDTNLDFINEVYRNANVGLLSISEIMQSVTDSELRKELLSEYDGYEKTAGEIAGYMKDKGYEAKELGGMKKTMMSTGIKMKTAMDDSVGHIAEMMIKGTVTGITELYKILNEADSVTDKKAVEHAEKLKSLEEKYEENLKKFL